MSDIDKRLDEILRRYIGNYETVDSYEKSINEANQAIKQLMVDEFEKLISGDSYSYINDDGKNDIIEKFNELRQKIKEWKDE